MKIRPKNIPKLLGGGLPSTVNWTDTTSNWFTRSGDFGILEGTYNMLKPLYDKWKASGNLSDYLAYKNAVDALNLDLRTGYAPGHLKYSNNGLNLFIGEGTESWQKRINQSYGFVNNSIGENFNKYNITSPKPTSGDRKGVWKEDDLWAGITDDRTTWGNLKGIDENNPEYQKWKLKFSEIGIDYRTNPEWNTEDVLYGFLNEDHFKSKNGAPSANVNDTSLQLNVPDKIEFSPKLLEAIEGTSGKVRVDDYPDDNKKNWWGEFSSKLLGLGPNILEDIRLGLSLNANKRIYDATLKGIRPNLMQTYNTHRQVVGDEATKQAYYRRAAAGQTKAALPFTSDADRLMAYQMEAKRIGDELRALGDLANNAEIRRTSDESNLHLWANTQRATEVANLNVAQINAANQAKWNLLALKYAADHSSWDNFLKGREYRWRQRLAEDLAYQRQLAALQNQYNLIDDSRILAAEQAVNNALEKTKVNGQYNHNHPEVLKAKRAYLKLLYELALEELKNQRLIRNPLFIKSGTKITYKKKDDLLYKSARDVVDHFRKMTKLTDDSYLKSRKNVPKLVSHPRKMLQGGVAPFTVFTPVAMGGEMGYQTTTNTSSVRGLSSSSSSENNKGKDTLDLIKKLFEAVHASGIPIDVLNIYNDVNNLLGRAEAFGKELSTLEIATIYLRSMNQLNRVKYEANAFDDAKKLAINKDALQEIAVDRYGRVAIQNREGLVEYVDPNKAKDKGIILTNDLLLNLRALSPQLAFDNLSLQTVNNGVGMTKISEWIKGNIATLGNSENSIEGYTKKLSNDIKRGLEILLDAPDGIYSVTTTTEDLKQLAAAALNYLLVSMPDNMKLVLNARAIISGVSPEEMITGLLTDTISSRISLKFDKKIDAVTGKAAKDSDGNSKEGLEINSAVLLLSGMSSPREFTFNIGNGNSFTGAARISSINDVNEVPFGADFSYSEIYKSSLRKNLDLDNASFGDIPINKALKDRIIIDNSTIAGIDLPYTVDSNGHIIPDFKMLSRIEEADKEVMLSGINPEQNPLKVNEIYAKYNLPIKYGSNNQLTGNYKRFAVVQATAIEDVFLNKDGLASNGTLTLVSDENEIDKYLEEIKKITGKEKIDIDRPGLFTGDKDIYKGSIFIPIIGDLTDAISGSKTGKLTENNYDDYRNKWNTKNYVKAPQYVKQ